jgi:hypothetical protein
MKPSVFVIEDEEEDAVPVEEESPADPTRCTSDEEKRCLIDMPDKRGWRWRCPCVLM